MEINSLVSTFPRFLFSAFPLYLLLIGLSLPVSADFSTSGRGVLYTIESLDAVTDAVTRQPDGNYRITSSITIANQTGADILQLTPGVALRFTRGSGLRIEGTLIAEGTDAAPITFTALDQEWDGIVFGASSHSEASVIEHARIEAARIGISCETASPRIVNTHFSQCRTYAIAIASADPIIRSNRFSNHRGATVIYAESAAPKIIDNELELNTSQTGVVLMTSDAHIAKNRFDGGRSAMSCRDSSPKIEGNLITGAERAISGLRSDFTISGNQILDSPTGIYADGGVPTIRSNHIRNSAVAAISIWDSPQGQILENRIDQSKIGIYSKAANLTIDQNQFEGNDYAIYIKEGTAAIRRNTIVQSTEAGIAFWSGASGEVMDNDIRTSRYGVYTQNASPTIRHNRISGGAYGVRSQSASPRITDNQITDASEGAIGCWDSHPEIEGNTLTGSRYGIYCDRASPVISRNTITGSLDAGVAAWNGSRPDLQDNLISGGRYAVFEEWKSARVEGGKQAGKRPEPARQERMEVNGRDDWKQESSKVEKVKKWEGDTGEFGMSTNQRPEQLQNHQSAIANPQSAISEPSSLFNADEQEALRHGQRANPSVDKPRQVTYQLNQSSSDNTAIDASPAAHNLPLSEAEGQSLPAPRQPADEKKPALTHGQSSRLMSLEAMLADNSIDINDKIATQFEMGRLHFKGGNYSEALEAYNWIVAHVDEKQATSASTENRTGDQEIANIHYHQALSYYELKDYAAAIEAARTCLSLQPESDVKVRAQYLIAMSAAQNRSSEMAENAFLELVKDLEKSGGDEHLPLLASAHFELGRLAVAHGAYREAMAHYANALSHGIDGVQHAEILSELGYCAAQLGEREAAVQWYKKLIGDAMAHSGLLAPAFLALGDLHREGKEWAQAEPFYQSALQHAEAVDLEDNVRGEIAFKLAESLYSQARFFEAIPAFERAIALDPDAVWHADAAYGLAACQYEMENFQAALDAYQRAADRYTQLIEANSPSSTLVQARERFALSKFQIAEIAARNATSEHDHVQLLNLYREARQASGGVEDDRLRSALQKDALIGEAKSAQKLGFSDTISQTALTLAAASRGDAVGLIQAADLLFDQGKYRSASGFYRQAIDLADKRGMEERQDGGLASQQSAMAHGWLRLGFCHFQLSQQHPTQRDENLRHAIDAYNHAIAYMQSTSDKQQPPMADVNNARYHAAVAHKLLGEYEQAVPLFEQVVETDKTDQFRVPSLLILAELYENAARYDEAIHTYEQAALSLEDPKDLAFALQRMGELCRQQGDYDTAIHHYQELLSHYPQSEYAAAAQYFTGLCYADAGEENTEFALAAYEKTVQHYPDSEFAIDAHWNAAAVSERIGQREKALRHAEQIIDRYERSDDAHAQEIVYSARNLVCNLLLADETRDPNRTAMLTQHLTAIGTSPNATPESKANAYFELGNLYAQAKDYETALVAYQRAKYDASPRLHTQIGDQETAIYFVQGEYDKVVKTGSDTLQRIAGSTNPQSETVAHLHYLIGQSQMQRDRPDEAGSAFQEVIALTEAGGEMNAYSHFYLGQTHQRRGQMDQAIPEYQAVLSIIDVDVTEPKLREIRAEAASQLAHIYEAEAGAADFDRTLNLYSQVSTADVSPELTAEAIYRRGLIHQRRNAPDEAAAEFAQLVERFPNSANSEIRAMVEDAILRLPNLSSQAGDVNAAITAAKAALQIAQQKADPLLLAQTQFQLATLHYQSGVPEQQKEAVELFKAAYANARRSKAAGGEVAALINAAMFQAGQSAYQIKDLRGAIMPLKDFIEAFPQDEKVNAAYEYLAWGYFTLADKTKSRNDRKMLFKWAAEAFDQLVARNANPDKSPEWIYQSAQALALAAKTTKAVAAYQQLVDMYPAHGLADDALYTMGGMQFGDKRYEEALQSYRQLVDQYPNSEWIDESLYTVATCYDKLNQREDALETYRAVIERFPDQVVAANAQANIGHDYFNRKEYAAALETYRKLTSKNFPAMDAKMRRDAYRWRRDTENIMAQSPYKGAVALLAKADTGAEHPSDEEKKYAQQAIQQFEQLIKDYPNSAYIDHAHVSMGTAHEIRAEWQDALKAYSRLEARHKKKPPTDGNVQKLLGYAQERSEAIKIFLLQKEKFGG
ncbi:MAG: tetratricopeptide repeat protein [Candidatus Poribacteria bacterium]|nr:tetratricopeptide repeat protein [Candidatus Poribacteria bacterium]